MNLSDLYERQTISALDWTFGRTVQRLGRCDDPWVGLAAALVSRSASRGDVCLDLALAHAKGEGGIPSEVERLGTARPFPFSLEQWRDRLMTCGAVGGPGDFRPLILDGQRLYLHRFWCFEQALAGSLKERCGFQAMAFRADLLDQALDRLFPDPATIRDSAGKEEPWDDQRQAARMAATRMFTVISGGPGTGKTYTVAKIIMLLQMLHPERPMKIHLAAPTGKAAARLQEAIEAALKASGPEVPASPSLPAAQTLHRLLGYVPAQSRFRYGAERQLSTDAVIVDEASMIDLSMMHQLVQAVPREARLILVGDKDQLASVEAGAVLGDICHGISTVGEPKPPPANNKPAGRPKPERTCTLDQHIQVLARSYRFDARSGLGPLSRAINEGDAQGVVQLLSGNGSTDLCMVPLSDSRALASAVAKEVADNLSGYFATEDPEEAFVQMNRFRILTALRQGPWGAEGLNQMVEGVLRHRGWIAKGFGPGSTWYRGRPVMVTRNDYHQGLFNGDIGIVFGPPNGGYDDMRVVFPAAYGGFRKLAPHQLPAHQTVYAMTIHKSQGSEFDRVMVVLPDQDTPLLTRELIYTAVTRARRSVVIHAEPELLRAAVSRRIQRSSGLREALWGDAN